MTRNPMRQKMQSTAEDISQPSRGHALPLRHVHEECSRLSRSGAMRRDELRLQRAAGSGDGLIHGS
jgi:hypothetical protein